MALSPSGGSVCGGGPDRRGKYRCCRIAAELSRLHDLEIQASDGLYRWSDRSNGREPAKARAAGVISTVLSRHDGTTHFFCRHRNAKRRMVRLTLPPTLLARADDVIE